jgi:hypothetical protein
MVEILEYPKTKMNNKSQLNLQKKICNLYQIKISKFE